MAGTSKKPYPLGKDSFFQHINLKRAWEQINSPRNALAIAGPRGSGKTELSRQIVKKFKTAKRLANFKSHEFPCDTTDHFLSDFRSFARSNGFPLEDSLRDDIELHIDKLFVEMNKLPCFKVFIFDDADLRATDILYHVDQRILEPLNTNPDDPQRAKWKIIITTNDAVKDFLEPCDVFKSSDILEVKGLGDDEIKAFLNQNKKVEDISDEVLKAIKEELGAGPSTLRVLRDDIDDGMEVKEALRQLVANIGKAGKESKEVVVQYTSLKKLIEQSQYKEEYKMIIMLLTMFSRLFLTAELLISCAEVMLAAGADKLENLFLKAENLKKELIRDLQKLYLCEKPMSFDDTTLISIPKLFSQGMGLLHRESSDTKRDVDLSRKALLALTRVMPRDGRAHQSHKIYGYLYSHACALVSEVKRLESKEEITRDKTPCIMLWMSNLQMAMGYCRYALRESKEKARAHIDHSLDTFAKLTGATSYSGIRSVVDPEYIHVDKARIMFEEITGPQSIGGENSLLMGSEHYKEMVKQVPLFLRLTKRDLKVLFGADEEGSSSPLTNGHLDDTQMTNLAHDGKALRAEQLQKFYAAELLAEIYSTAAKARGFHADATLSQECTQYAKAALYLYEKIKQEFGVSLMAEVITERTMLRLKLNQEELTEAKLDDIKDRWKALADRKDKAFEYGLMRADFGNDSYNAFLCKEGMAICKGLRCSITSNRRLQQVCDEFESLIKTTKEDDPKLDMNLQTTSKVYRNYGYVLWKCGKYQEAVKKMISAFSCLHEFLLKRTGVDKFPEIDTSSGKAKPLLRSLNKYFEDYQRCRSPNGLLQHDGSDQMLITYVKDLVKEWRKRKDRSMDYSVMEKILESSGIDVETLEETLGIPQLAQADA